MAQPSWAQADGNNLLLGKGAVYFDRFNASGVKQGSFFMGNVTQLEIAPSVQTAEKYGSVDSSNQLLARVETSRTLEANLTFSERLRRNLALALLGDASAYTQAATPVVAEALVASSTQGSTLFTAKPNISAVTVKVGAATKTITTDYLLDAASGAIYIVPGGGIADGSAVTVDYTPVVLVAADNWDKVTIGTAGNILGELRFVGDPKQGKVEYAVLWKCQVSPTGAVGFITDDYADHPLRLTLLSDAVAHPTEPFGRIIRKP